LRRFIARRSFSFLRARALWFDGVVWSGPLSVAQRWNSRLHGLFLLLLFLAAVFNAFRPMLDQVDLGWHVAQGRWMAHHLAFYRFDALNYPTAGQPIVDEYPLFQLALYLSTLCGWWGPCLLCALGYVLLLAILVLTGVAVEVGASSIFALMLGAMLIDLSIAFPLRPHLVTFLGIAAFGSFLLRHREASVWTRFWPLALVQVIWTNCHSGFVLGPAMVAVFGAEMVLRRWQGNRLFPWTTVRIWSAATALVFLGCFVNPYGVARFGAPFYQEHLEVIRAYVGEMQPLNPGAAANFERLTLYAALLIGTAVYLRRGAVSWSFLLLAAIFYFEALQMKKMWPVFGVFLPLLVLSTAAFARTTITRRKGLAPVSIAGHLIALFPLVAVLGAWLGSKSDSSLRVRWHEWDAGRTELPVAAATWMKQNHLAGRIMHRCEDGGWLQMEKILPTFADTGFGKYDEAFIRLTGLMADRPALLAGLIRDWQPQFVVFDDFAFQWPSYLRQAGCRLIFYSPNSTVWAVAGARPDLPTVTPPEIEGFFLDDVRAHGLPRDMLLFGRDLVALNSMGDSKFAVAQLTGLPPDMHRAGWYWEAARLMCFDPPRVPDDLRRTLRTEANTLPDATREFRAYDDEANHQLEAARSLVLEIPQKDLSDREAILLLRINLALHPKKALELSVHEKLFDQNDGEYWRDRAMLLESSGPSSAGDQAWAKVLYYAPDLMPSQASFFQAHPNIRLGSFLTVYGWPPFYPVAKAPPEGPAAPAP
jgi:hypothetical protein